MLESGSEPSKRQSNFRNRTNNRRNSRDRLDRPNPLGSESGERVASFNLSGTSTDCASSTDKTKSGGSETCLSGKVEMNGCSNSEAVQLMNERWAAALQSQNDPALDVTDRPVVYSSSEGTSAWGTSKASYQASVNDFLAEVAHAIRQSKQ